MNASSRDASRLAGGRPECGRSIESDNPAVSEKRESVAVGSVIHRMAGNHDGRAGLGHPSEMTPEDGSEIRIQADGRFVQQKQRRAVDQGYGQTDTLTHASAEIMDRIVASRRQPHYLDGLFHGPSARPPVRHSVHPREEVNILPDREFLVQRRELGHIADPRRVSRSMGTRRGW